MSDSLSFFKVEYGSVLLRVSSDPVRFKPDPKLFTLGIGILMYENRTLLVSHWQICHGLHSDLRYC